MDTLLLNDGTQAPWIAFGTGTRFFELDVTDNVQLAIDNGFRHLDGAQQYRNERTLGAGIVASGVARQDLYITTKLSKLAPGETPIIALQRSLARLGVPFVDLYLIHQTRALEDSGLDLEGAWAGMVAARAAGLTTSIGVSNFTANDLNVILGPNIPPPAVNQLEVHPHVWADLQPTLQIHAANNIVTSSYGGLAPIRIAGSPLPPVIEQIRARLEATLGAPVSNSQVYHKWLKQKGVLVVTTSNNAGRILEYIATAALPNLTQIEIDLIENTGAQLFSRIFPVSWWEPVDDQP